MMLEAYAAVSCVVVGIALMLTNYRGSPLGWAGVLVVAFFFWPVWAAGWLYWLWLSWRNRKWVALLDEAERRGWTQK
jgi:hypothetical protein